MFADLQFTKKNLDGHLKELGKEFRKLNGTKISVEIILIGGVAIFANYAFREMTYDIDACSFFKLYCDMWFQANNEGGHTLKWITAYQLRPTSRDVYYMFSPFPKYIFMIYFIWVIVSILQILLATYFSFSYKDNIWVWIPQ